MRALATCVLLLALAPAAQAAGLQVQASTEPRSVGLGDAFRYTVEARGPHGPRITVLADSGPFLVVAAPRTTRSSSGGTDAVRVEQTLMCLDRGCAPSDGARRVSLPAARAKQGTSTATAQAPPLKVVPRVPKAAVKASRAVYRRDAGVAGVSIPGALVPLLVAVALVCVLLAAALVALELRRPRAAAGRFAVVDALERALRLLRESAGRPAPDRRRAADLASRVAGERGGDTVAADATRLAWAPPEPEATDVGELAEEIETTLGGGR